MLFLKAGIRWFCSTTATSLQHPFSPSSQWFTCIHVCSVKDYSSPLPTAKCGMWLNSAQWDLSGSEYLIPGLGMERVPSLSNPSSPPYCLTCRHGGALWDIQLRPSSVDRATSYKDPVSLCVRETSILYEPLLPGSLSPQLNMCSN